MTKRIVTAVAAFGLASIISGCDLKQPSAGCIVQDSSFANWQAKYVLKNAADASKACGGLKGEAIGVWKYTDPTKPNSNRLAIRTEGAAALTADYEYEYTTAGGAKETETVRRVEDAATATALASTLSEEPDAEGMCQATGFNVATVTATEVRHVVTNEQLVAQESVSYAFEKVEVFSHPSAPGTQLRGTLKYSVNGGEACEYTVNALWPQIGCVPGSNKPAESCGEGSGLNPDFDAVCDAELEACVLAKPAPSFKVELK